MEPTIKAVAFDAYGTLFDVYSVGALAETLAPGRGVELAALWRDKQIGYTFLRALGERYADFATVTADALDFCCDELKINLGERGRARLLDQYMRLPAFPENVAALRRMKDLGLPLAILSNGTRSMLDSVVEAAGMATFFDHILSVDDVKTFKTAPRAYQLGPDAFGCRADEILFVSSNGWDACGAAWFGYTTFWINRAKRPLERLGVAPDFTGHTMHDVADLLESRGPRKA